MENRESESGLELVLDNRKLIIAFGLLIAICGCFFVVGFIEGKRQGVQEGSQAANESAPKQASETVQVQSEKPSASISGEQKSPSAEPSDQPLEWYKHIKKQGEEPATAALTPTPNAAPKGPAPDSSAAKAEDPKPQANAEPAAYTVQVGAFRLKEELDRTAQTLRAKGFECRTEGPAGPGQLYYLKVGNFRSRAEASAMRLRLEREGFSAFIKTN